MSVCPRLRRRSRGTVPPVEAATKTSIAISSSFGLSALDEVMSEDRPDSYWRVRATVKKRLT
jgi:hypothetical protein